MPKSLDEVMRFLENYTLAWHHWLMILGLFKLKGSATKAQIFPIYKKEGFVDTLYDDTTKIIEVFWDHLYDGEVVKASCQAQLDEVRKGAKVIIVDTSKTDDVPPQDCQQWFASYLFPEYKREGFKALITVLSPSALTRLASKQWSKTGEIGDFGFEVYEADSLESARQLAQKLLG